MNHKRCGFIRRAFEDLSRSLGSGMQLGMQNGMFVPQEHQSDTCFLDIGNNSHRYQCCLRSQSMRDRKKDKRSVVTFALNIFHFLPCESRCKLYKLSPNHGKRLGEAKNPGPERIFTFCATNPTALFNKTSAVLSLGAHCTFLAETSATKCAQMSISQDFAATPQKLFWGKPVLPRSVQHKEDSLRGQSIGVAVVTSLPARLPHQIDHSMFDTCRFQEIWLQVGCLPVLCITVYGFHADQQDHNHFNCVLLNSILASASQTTGCVLIGGDLNAMLYP